MASQYKILTADDIFYLPDVRTGFAVLREWGIDSRGMKDLKTIKEALIEHWKNKIQTSQQATEEVTSGLKEAIANSKQNRDFLIKKFEEMLSLFSKLPPTYQSSLNKVFPFLEDTSHRKINELRSNECAVLVAGESGAGKSTLINLLTGVDILQTSQIACTASFCELRYSSKKYAKCFAKEGRTRKIDLTTPDGIEELHRELAYKTDDVDDNENEKVEIYWPFDILEDGIVIIDTPGIGTSKDMTEKIQQYLTKAFGCIYVINSSSAGGVQKGRIVDFLMKMMNLSEDRFNPNTTMFVCNKWEEVPSTDKAEVQKISNYKLRQCYPDFRSDQVYYMSAITAHQAVSHGVILQDHKTVLQGINQLLPASLENKYENYYRWLSTVVKRMQFVLKVSKHARMENIEQLKSKIENIEKQMYRLQENAESSIRNLREEVQKEVNALERTIMNLLTSENFRKNVTSWQPSDCPPSDKKWKKVSGSASDLIAQRLTKVINDWERENRIKAGIKNKIIGRFKKDFELMEDQINDIEGMFLGDETRILADLQKTIKGNKKKKDKLKGKGDKQNVVGIGGAVAVLGTLGKESKDTFRKYKKDKNAQVQMAEATDLFIDNIIKSKDLKENLSRFVQRYAKGIDRIAELIPDFLEGDRQMLAALKEEAEQTMSDNSSVYLAETNKLQGNLDLYYVDFMMHVDYHLSDIDCKWDDKLGQGSFADVYFGVLKTSEGERLDVALKKSKDELKSSTVTDILLEDRTMRDVKHDNFIIYHGNALRKIRGKTYWVMIMECCIGSLKDVFIDRHFELKVANPANCNTITERTNAIKEMASYGKQLCNGLDYLHSKKMVHRDLKLENVLVTRTKIVKLTDVGLTKPEVDITGTMTGSPVYMAPEVLNSSGIYDRTADIYSLGIMIWEMWYGVDAADHIGPRLINPDKIGLEIKDGLRPSFSLREKPDEHWRELMERCWGNDVANRPSAKVVMKFFHERIL